MDALRPSSCAEGGAPGHRQSRQLGSFSFAPRNLSSFTLVGSLLWYVTFWDQVEWAENARGSLELPHVSFSHHLVLGRWLTGVSSQHPATVWGFLWKLHIFQVTIPFFLYLEKTILLFVSFIFLVLYCLPFQNIYSILFPNHCAENNSHWELVGSFYKLATEFRHWLNNQVLVSPETF